VKAAQVAMRALLVTLIDRRLRDVGLEHHGRFVPSADEAGDDRIDIVEVEGGIPASICLSLPAGTARSTALRKRMNSWCRCRCMQRPRTTPSRVLGARSSQTAHDIKKTPVGLFADIVCEHQH
jgi:hypothetical protein